MKRSLLYTVLLIVFVTVSGYSQHSVARDWNEEVLNGIRKDFARPTVHARNLFHASVLMYDAWAIFNEPATTVFLGKTFKGFETPYTPLPTPTDKEAAIHEIMSYAVYRLMAHRFQESPGAPAIFQSIQGLMNSYGYNLGITSTNYSNGSYAALGNYMASKMIEFGFQDNSNELFDYSSQFYAPVNPPMILAEYNDNDFINPNKWQPLAFAAFIDQSGNVIPGGIPNFLTPEWGDVKAFALDPNDLEILNNGSLTSYVYNDPGPPPSIQNSTSNGIDDPYKWHFSLVASWSAHLDPADATLIDISPASLGNVSLSEYPSTFAEYKNFYDFQNGGAINHGHDVNPITGLPYTPQLVKRGDYARVLAEFWADGPDSETPPGHWFTILNYVSDHPLVEKKFAGQGPVLSDLEWDVKLYLTLGGAMHDSAITTWGIKGYYDYIRPISSIRYMAAKGQSTDPNLPNFDPHGLPLINGLFELVEVGDPLAGANNEFVGEVKVFAWKGPDYIDNPETQVAGVDWILAKRWWPYQRPTFVTPPFAGYVSGHSTFSRAAAEVLTLATGDAFFPGGMGTFEIEQNDFLVFEKGPSESFTLQWATYRDASDQTSLSRIWGGIHPPIDDIPGRILGEQIGIDAFHKASDYFQGILGVNENILENAIVLSPNPATSTVQITHPSTIHIEEINIYDITGRLVREINIENQTQPTVAVSDLKSAVYLLQIKTNTASIVKRLIIE